MSQRTDQASSHLVIVVTLCGIMGYSGDFSVLWGIARSSLNAKSGVNYQKGAVTMCYNLLESLKITDSCQA